MTSALISGMIAPAMICQQIVARGISYPGAGGAASIQLLPTDSIGNCTLTLINLVIGSAVEVELASGGTVIANTTTAATSLVLTIPVYQSGSTSNSIRIKVRKGSASPYYQPYETLFTVAVGSASIYISQLLDE